MSTQLAPLDPMFALLCAFLVGCLICLIAELWRDVAKGKYRFKWPRLSKNKTPLVVCSSSNSGENAAFRDPYDPAPRKGYLSVDDYFMTLAFLSGQRSKDPRKQVGSCIVNAQNIILAVGYNGFPRGCPDSDLPWAKSSRNKNPLDTKYPYVVHAEANAILNKNTADLTNSRMYVTLFPCCECAKLLIQAGVKEIIYYEDKSQSGDAMYEAARILFSMAGVQLRHMAVEGRQFWFVDGQAYDLKLFEHWHPGGAALLRQTRGRDVSILFHTQHRDVQRLKPLLEIFSVDKNGVPGRFGDEAGILKELHEQLGTEAWREKITWSNIGFGASVVVLCLCYVFIQWRALEGQLKLLPYAVLMAILRICLTTIGKYFLYRKQSFVNVVLSFLMDVDYRGSALTGFERRLQQGTHSNATRVNQIKRLPRIYRFPIDVCRQLLFPVESCTMFCSTFWQCMTGHASHSGLQICGFVLVRGWLIVEMWLFLMCQKLDYWLIQCSLVSGFSFVLAICEHTMHSSSSTTDWTKRQIESQVDLSLTGSPSVDCFLTSGLSCRRLHALLPFQWSPFANNTCEPLIKEICQAKEIDWRPAVHLLSEQLPRALDAFLFSKPEWKERDVSLWTEYFSKTAFWNVANFFQSVIWRDCMREKPIKME